MKNNKQERIMIWGFIPPDQGDRAALEEYKECGFDTCCMTENYYKINTPEYWNCLKLMEEVGLDAYIIFYKRQTGHYHKHLDGIDLHDYPAVKGLHMMDEPEPDQIKLVSDIYVPWFNENYSDLAFFMNTHGGCWPEIEKRYVNHIESCIENINNKIKCENKFFSIDHYPIRVKGYWEYYLNDQAYLHGLAITAKKVKETDSKFGGCIQTFEGYMNCKYPNSIGDLRFQIFCQLAFGVKSLCYFVYKSEETIYYFFRGMITLKGKRTPLYDLTKQMNAEIRTFDKEYMSYDWQGVTLVDGLERSEKNSIFSYVREHIGLDYTDDNVASIEAQRDILLGCFSKEGDKRAYVLADFNEPSKRFANRISIQFKNGKTARVNLNGEEKKYELIDGVLDITIHGGDGVYIVVE